MQDDQYVPELGEVHVERGRQGWYYVAIGRHGRTKRFNLSADEAAKLVTGLAELGVASRASYGDGG